MKKNKTYECPKCHQRITETQYIKIENSICSNCHIEMKEVKE